MKSVNFKGHIVKEDGTIIGKRGKPIKGGTVPGPYRKLNVWDNGKLKSTLWNRFVWEAFNGEIPANKHIDHIDNNKFNNALNNLRCVNPQENMNNRTGKYSK